jgi:hypothetical protein
MSGATIIFGDWMTKAIVTRGDAQSGETPKVKAIVQYRSDGTAVGDNLRVVLHTRGVGAASNEWSSVTWTGPEGLQSGAKWIFDQWSLPYWQASLWEVSLPEFGFLAPADPVGFIGGLPEGDPFEGALIGLPNADVILAWLEDAGYGAAVLPQGKDPATSLPFLSRLTAVFEYGELTDDHAGASAIVLGGGHSPIPVSRLPLPGGSESNNWNYHYVHPTRVYNQSTQCTVVWCEETIHHHWIQSGASMTRTFTQRVPGGRQRHQSGPLPDASAGIIQAESFTITKSCYVQNCNQIEVRVRYSHGVLDSLIGSPGTLTTEYRLAAFQNVCCGNFGCATVPPCVMSWDSEDGTRPSYSPWGPGIPVQPAVVVPE